MALVKSGSRRIPIGFENRFAMDGPFYGRVEPKKPAVVRKGYSVKKCFFWDGTGQCLNSQCFWLKAGDCAIHSRMRVKRKIAK